LTTFGLIPGKARTTSSCRQNTFLLAPAIYTLMLSLRNLQINKVRGVLTLCSHSFSKARICLHVSCTSLVHGSKC